MQTLTLRGIKRKALAWYKRGKLIAQQPEPIAGIFILGECRCAIAASFNAATIKALDNMGPTYKQPFRITPKAVVEAVNAIADAHDAWINGTGSEKQFLNLLRD